ncbi:hypothetical protein J3F83DRAFT_723602 [Trichoderma novae-zelandiae]
MHGAMISVLGRWGDEMLIGSLLCLIRVLGQDGFGCRGDRPGHGGVITPAIPWTDQPSTARSTTNLSLCSKNKNKKQRMGKEQSLQYLLRNCPAKR